MFQNKLAKYVLLIIDEVGYIFSDKEVVDLLFTKILIRLGLTIK